MDCSYMQKPVSCSNCQQPLPSQAQQPVSRPQSASCPTCQQSPYYGSWCPNTGTGGMEQYAVGMGYVPWQQWQQTYTLDKALEQGTIFPVLDKPFWMGRCCQ